MGWPVVIVGSGGIPVTEVANGLGAPVTVAANGLGTAVTVVAAGGMPVLSTGGGFDIYVDSVNGSDSNDGSSPASALRSIAAISLADGKRVGLRRGSYWREQLGTDVGGPQNVRVGAYGTGRLPILDAADVASANGWTAHATYAGVYQRVWSHSAAAGMFVSLWEDGVRLRWVASEAALNAASAGFYVATTSGVGSSTIYYKATGATNPASNGRTVEISRRHFGLVSAAAGWIVEDLHTRRQLHNDGSVALYGLGSVARRLLAEDGTKHNMLISRNALAEDCIAWKCDWADRTGSTAFVAHTADGRGYSARFRRCVTVMEIDKVAAAIADGKAIDAFYAHTSNGAQKWDEIVYEDCSIKGAVTGLSAGDTALLTITRPMMRDVRVAISPNATTTNIIDPWLIGAGTDVLPNRFVSPEVSGATVTVEGARVLWAGPTWGGVVWNNQANTTITVQKSVIYRISGQSGYAEMINGQNPNSTVYSYNNIIVGPSPGNDEKGFGKQGNGNAASNVYWVNGMDFEIGPNSYTDFASYRAANPSLDVGSISADPLLNNPSAGDFGVQSGSPAISRGAGLERVNITYTPIPSSSDLGQM